MDRTSQGFVQKIISELSKINTKLEELLKHPTNAAPSGKNQSNDRAEPPKAQIDGSVGASAEHDSARPKTTKKNSYEKYTKRLKKANPWIQLIGLVVLVIYTAYTGCQVRASREANRLLEESTRAILSPDFRLEPIGTGGIVRLEVVIKNVGHSIAIVGTSQGYDRRVKLPEGDMPIPPGVFNTILEPEKTMFTRDFDPDVVTQDLLDNIPRFSDLGVVLNAVPHSPTIYLYGRFDYETLGKKHKLEWCDFVMRNDNPSILSTDSLRNEPFVIHTCPKWNSSR